MDYVDVRGARVPALGLGTWQMTGMDCRQAVEHALSLGYRHIDTAQGYANEADIGGALRQSSVPRDELWITTKIWPDYLRHDDVLRSTHESLKRLALDHLDLLLIHWPSKAVPLEETMSALEQLRDQGATRYIGVSNFPPGLLEQARRLAPILTNQVEYHPYLGQAHLVKYAQAFEIMLTAYSPLAQGRVHQDPTLRDIGARHGKSASQVALRWLVQQQNVSAIPKAQSPEHLKENLDIFDFELDIEDRKRIASLERGERLINPDIAPDWNQLQA